MEIVISKSILHVLDTNIDIPVLSDECIPLSPDTEEFLTGHISKAAESDDGKTCAFQPGSSFLFHLEKATEQFIEASKEIAEDIFEIMKQNPAIPNGDLAVVQAQLNGEPYLILLKMNYKDSFIHYLNRDTGSNSNIIVHQRTVLPHPKNRAEEIALIQLHTQEIRLIEKKYEIDGKKSYYFSERILQCTQGLSEKQKLSTVQKAAAVIQEKFYDNAKEVEAHVAAVLCDQAELGDEATVEELCESFYGDSEVIKQEFTQVLREQNVKPSDTIQVSPSAARKMEKQSLKAASGVEIKIPIQLYQDKDAVEFINNPDGSISLLIKNVIL